MNNLPQELISLIVWFAERYPGADGWYPAIGQYFGITDSATQFPHLVTLSRSWKEAVEAITFRQLGLKSNELGTLQPVVIGKRRKLVLKISFTALLPEYPYEACWRPETWVEQRLNNKSFTKGIADMFAVLKGWEDDGVRNTRQ